MNATFFDKWARIFMRRLMDDFGLSVHDAAAVIGNAGHESGGFQSLQEKQPIVPGSRGGYGIMQWTGPRRRAFEAYCKRNGFNPADMNANYKFLFVELKGPEGRVLPKLKAARTFDEKVEVFCKGFLRPGIVHMNARKVWAGRALDAFNAAGGAKVPAKPSSAPVPSPRPDTGTRKSAPGLIGAFIAIVAAIIAAIGKKEGWF